jgi:Kef-type K+ transport system membrane component KefB
MPNLFILVLQVAVVLTACRLTGALFRKFQQPRVVGEMFAGIMLGPSLLGWIAPHFSAYLFPASSLGFLNALSQIGVIIFMFLVGLGINPKELQKEGHAAVLSSHVSITAPFVLAAFLALYLYPRLSDDSVAFSSFALFMGAAMSITAFPVLARILQERKMMHSRLGTVAIACAAVDDVTGWIILAYIVVLIRAAHSPTSIWVTLGGIVVFAVIMIYGVQRLLQHIFLHAYERWGHLSENRMAFMILLVLASSLLTESIPDGRDHAQGAKVCALRA